MPSRSRDPDTERLVLRLASAGMSQREIAEALGQPRTTLQSRHADALESGALEFIARTAREARAAIEEWRRG